MATIFETKYSEYSAERFSDEIHLIYSDLNIDKCDDEVKLTIEQTKKMIGILQELIK